MALPILETPRLLLRPFTLSDAPAVQRLAGDAAVADTTLNLPHPYPDGAAEAWIATHGPQHEAGEADTFAIVRRDDGALLGAISLLHTRRFNRAELGYWVGRPYWGQGICTAAGQAVLRYAFRDLGLRRVHAIHLARNPASGRVMQKLGMTREGLLRQHARKGEQYEDLVVYGLLREEWERASGA